MQPANESATTRTINSLITLPQRRERRAAADTYLHFLAQAGQYLSEAAQASLQLLDDVLGQIIGIRKVVQIREAFVLEPEHIETGLIARRVRDDRAHATDGAKNRWLFAGLARTVMARSMPDRTAI
jgi:hypothetical protein